VVGEGFHHILQVLAVHGGGDVLDDGRSHKIEGLLFHQILKKGLLLLG
jgi:hypothetical protein